jgi:hypothetical protein
MFLGAVFIAAVFNYMHQSTAPGIYELDHRDGIGVRPGVKMESKRSIKKYVFTIDG